MKKIAIIASLALLSSGCATQNYLLTDQSVSTQPTVTRSQTFFVSGLAQEQEIDAAKVCNGAQNVAKIKTEMTVINFVLGHLSSGIYTPRQISVFCNK